MSGDLAMSRTEAELICDRVWPSAEEAIKQAALLCRAAWAVQWRGPGAEFGAGSGRMIVASVYDPRTFCSPGDVIYRADGGSGARLGGECNVVAVEAPASGPDEPH